MGDDEVPTPATGHLSPSRIPRQQADTNSGTTAASKLLNYQHLDEFEQGMSQLYIAEDSSMQQAVNAPPFHPPQAQQQHGNSDM